MSYHALLAIFGCVDCWLPVLLRLFHYYNNNDMPYDYITQMNSLSKSLNGQKSVPLVSLISNSYSTALRKHQKIVIG